MAEVKRENIYYFDNADYFKIRNALYSIKKDKIIKNDLSYYDMLFSNSKAVFYVPHQDDETLFYYIYAILHSNEYLQKFSSDLQKAFPRIPILKNKEKYISTRRSYYEA